MFMDRTSNYVSNNCHRSHNNYDDAVIDNFIFLLFFFECTFWLYVHDLLGLILCHIYVRLIFAENNEEKVIQLIIIIWFLF